MNGFKFLDPTGSTYYEGNETVCPLPGPDEKWGPEFVHPEPAEPDGDDCGPGRWHVMKKPSAQYAPRNWWAWYIKSTGVIVGESDEKYGTTALRLRRISPKVWHRLIRLGWCSNANLRDANLRNANLRNANLWNADLRDANLRNADLRNANLRNADLWNADLRDANLRNANLWNANLRDADLRYADLRYADLRNADLRDVLHNKYTQWPEGFDMSRLEIHRDG